MKTSKSEFRLNIPFIFILALSIIPFCLEAQVEKPKKYGLFVDGAYDSQGRGTTTMDSVVDMHIDSLRSAMIDSRIVDHDKAMIARSKQAMLDSLRSIDCKCGDTVTIAMIGHGRGWLYKSKREQKEISPNEVPRFYFAKEDETLEANDLRDLITEVAGQECCCKFNVIIYACAYDHDQGGTSFHELEPSGWIQELMMEPHTHSVYVSTSHKLLTWTLTWNDERGNFHMVPDWMSRFVEGIRRGSQSHSSMDEILGFAENHAKETAPIFEYGIQKPSSWKRGEQEIVAHIEGFSRNNEHVLVTLHEPSFFRGAGILKLKLPDAVNTDNFEKCRWISGTALFSEPNTPLVGKGNIRLTDNRPTERIRGHVTREINRSTNVLAITPIGPRWSIGGRTFTRKPQTLGQEFRCEFVEKSGSYGPYPILVQVNGTIANSVKRCSWVDFRAEIVSPTIPRKFTLNIPEGQRLEPSNVILRNVRIKWSSPNRGGGRANANPTVQFELGGDRWLNNHFSKKGKKELQMDQATFARISKLKERNAVVDIEIYIEAGKTKYRVNEGNLVPHVESPGRNITLGVHFATLLFRSNDYSFYTPNPNVLETKILETPDLYGQIIQEYKSDITITSDPVDHSSSPSIAFGINGSIPLRGNYEASWMVDYFKSKFDAKYPFMVFDGNRMDNADLSGELNNFRFRTGIDRYWYGKWSPFVGLGLSLNYITNPFLNVNFGNVQVPLETEDPQISFGGTLSGGVRYDLCANSFLTGRATLLGSSIKESTVRNKWTYYPQLGLGVTLKF